MDINNRETHVIVHGPNLDRILDLFKYSHNDRVNLYMEFQLVDDKKIYIENLELIRYIDNSHLDLEGICSQNRSYKGLVNPKKFKAKYSINTRTGHIQY